MVDIERQCRICGNSKLDKLYYALEISNKLELYNLLKRDGSLDQLIRPCECRGEFAFAHKICLSNWLETTKHEYCDICRLKYNVTFVEQSIFDWLLETNQLKRVIKVASLSLLVYYLSALGIMVSNQHEASALTVMIKSSAYIWTFKCTVALVVIIYRELTSYKAWKVVNKRVIVEENKNPQLDSQVRPKDVLRYSGFRPQYVADRTIMKI